MDNPFANQLFSDQPLDDDFQRQLPSGQATDGFLDLSSPDPQTSVTLQQGVNKNMQGALPRNTRIGANNSAGGSNQSRVRRRNRLITSCLECRRRKLKCDRSSPCSNCLKHGRTCLFIAGAMDATAQNKIAEMKEKVGSLERVLEKDIARKLAEAEGVKGASSSGEHDSQAHANGPAGETDNVVEDEADGDDDLEASPLSTTDAAYEENPDDDLVDLGIQLGKLRVTDRIGGLFRPKFASELKLLVGKSAQEMPTQPPHTAIPPDQMQLKEQDFLQPGPDYLDPSAAVFLGRPVLAESIASNLPTKATTDKLLERYWFACHPISRMIYRPSFEQRYTLMWAQISIGEEPSSSFVALTLAALLSAAISLSEEQVTKEYSIPHHQLVDRVKSSVELVLFKANFLRTAKLETLQAFVLYLTGLCRTEVSRAHSALTGSAIRLAECMGLHRDGTLYNLSPAEVHIRRMIWYQLCYLDIRTFEATGPRPHIRKEDFDTKLPLNVDDDELESPFPPSKDSQKWTDMTLSLIRFEWYEVYRMIWVESKRIEEKKQTITAVLRKIAQTRSASEKKYTGMLNASTPLGVLAFHLHGLLASRPYVMLLNRYHNSVKRDIPVRLRNVTVSSCIGILENAIALETIPSLAPWSWYSGAFQQYHAALLLLVDTYMHPNDRFADRVWPCLDHAFMLPHDVPREQKVLLVLTELSNRMNVYSLLRKPRATAGMEHQYRKMYGDVARKQQGRELQQGLQKVISQEQPQNQASSTPSTQAQPSPLQHPHQSGPTPPTQMFPLGGLAAQDGLSEINFSTQSGQIAFEPSLVQPDLSQHQQHHPILQNQQVGLTSENHSSPQGLTPESTTADSNDGSDMALDIDWEDWDKIFQANDAFDLGSTWQMDASGFTTGPVY